MSRCVRVCCLILHNVTLCERKSNRKTHQIFNTLVLIGGNDTHELFVISGIAHVLLLVTVVFVTLCVLVCSCVWERERDRGRKRERNREKERERARKIEKERERQRK